MKSISIDEAKKNIFDFANYCEETSSPLLVTNPHGSNFVILSEKTWNDIQKTLSSCYRQTIIEARKEDYSKKKSYLETETW